MYYIIAAWIFTEDTLTTRANHIKKGTLPAFWKLSSVLPFSPHGTDFYSFTYLFYLFAVLAFELRAYTLSHSTSSVLQWVFQDRVSPSICLGLEL
jgi:hypothetical protein